MAKSAAFSLLQASGGEQSLHTASGRALQKTTQQSHPSQATGVFATKEYGAAGNVITQPAESQVVVSLEFTNAVNDSKVAVSFTADRENADPGGGGVYEFLIDGVVVGHARNPLSNVRGTISMSDIFTVGGGLHTLSVQVTGQVGAETTYGFAELQAIGYGAI